MVQVVDVNYVSAQWAKWRNPEDPLRASVCAEDPDYDVKACLFGEYLFKIKPFSGVLSKLRTLCTYETHPENFRLLNEWAQFCEYAKDQLRYKIKENPDFGLPYFERQARRALKSVEDSIEMELGRAWRADQVAYLDGKLPASTLVDYSGVHVVRRFPQVVTFKQHFFEKYPGRAFSLLFISPKDNLDLVNAYSRIKHWLELERSLFLEHGYALQDHPSVGLTEVDHNLTLFLKEKVRSLWHSYHMDRLHGGRSLPGLDKKLGMERSEKYTAVFKRKRQDRTFTEEYRKLYNLVKFKDWLEMEHGIRTQDEYFDQLFLSSQEICDRIADPPKRRDTSPRRRKVQ